MRLLTRADFDGLACGALLREVGVIDSCKFIHPKDMQDGIVEVTSNDVLANVPYVKGCSLWFDHHASETTRLGDLKFDGESRLAPSCARIIYEYYGGKARMPHLEPMVNGADKVDSGNLTADEILRPQGWVLLGFVMDPRTGLGRFRNFTIGNYDLMELLMDSCRIMGISQILNMPDVVERINVYFEQDELFRKMITHHTRLDKNVIITDLRGVDPIYTGNRFLIYSMYPEQNISVWIVEAKNSDIMSIAVGHSILNRTSNTDVGNLLLTYGGGGHRQVGTCQISADDTDRVAEELIEKLKSDG